MVFGHHHRSHEYEPPASLLGQIVMCTYAAGMFCAMCSLLWVIWLRLTPWIDGFALTMSIVVTPLLVLGAILMARLFHCTLTGK